MPAYEFSCVQCSIYCIASTPVSGDLQEGLT